MTGTYFTLEIQPVLPPRLERLTELANDLYYSWDSHTRGLFLTLDRELWEECSHNPKVFMRRVSQDVLEEAASDRAFLEEYQRTLANYDTYLVQHEELRRSHELDSNTDLIAYFCAEFGLHESLPVYSGGLGILAGDYCKASSDLAIPFIAVGLLYRQGNSTQTIDGHGNQVTGFQHVPLEDLPIKPALDATGKEVYVNVELPHTTINIKVWWAKAGRTDLYLLDTDVEGNTQEDRAITYQIYPADQNNRFKQEIVLGIGGTRALASLGLKPAVWHINEGHPCLQIVERWRQYIAQGIPSSAALELVAASTVFTTHTPVPAGHEVYDTSLVTNHLSGYIKQLGVTEKQFLELGKNDNSHGFNLTSFSIRCSRFHNGVSRVHRGVAAEMEKNLWSEIPVAENPMDYVTNGVHVPTFLAREWINTLDDHGWGGELRNPDYWQCIDRISDAQFWSIHLALKSKFYKDCVHYITKRCRRTGHSQAQIRNEVWRLQEDEDALVIGFARRFATYKRATLLFDDPDRLARLLNDPERPVVIVIAGKAHPHDEPGKSLIRRIHEMSREERFHGRVILLEGYDMSLARQLVCSVDLWLNTPEYPLEACGTSGMKAAINGVINLSVLDGWWAEGWNGDNGWGLQPHDSETDPQKRRMQENMELLDMLEEEIIPLYFNRSPGYSEGWIRVAKESMKSIIPQFNSQRMVMDYVNKFYLPSIAKTRELLKNDGNNAQLLAEWNAAVRKQWPGVRIRRIDNSPSSISQGNELSIRVGVYLNGLGPEDVHVECLLGKSTSSGTIENHSCLKLEPAGTDGDETIYELRFTPELPGLVGYQLRVYPYHRLLCHYLQTGFMKWV